MKQYHWLLFNPLDHAWETFEGETPEKPALCYTELCHTSGDHFDSVITIDEHIPTSPPQLHCTKHDIFHECCLIQYMYFIYKKHAASFGTSLLQLNQLKLISVHSNRVNNGKVLEPKTG